MKNIAGKEMLNVILLERLTDNLDEIEQVKLRLIEPEATNLIEWFLKPDLNSYPRYAVSESKNHPHNRCY